MNIITNMFRKDLILLKNNKYILFFLIFPLSMGLSLFQTSNIQQAAVNTIMGILFTAYVLVTYVFGLEDRNKFNIVFSSFPVNRNLIVLYKYIFIILTFVIGVLLTCIIPFTTIVFSNKGVINTQIIRFAFIVYIIYFMIYLPVYFKIGYYKMRKVNTPSYLLVILMPFLIPKLSKNEVLNKIFISILNSIKNVFLNQSGIIFLLILMFVSFLISLNIFSRREF